MYNPNPALVAAPPANSYAVTVDRDWKATVLQTLPELPRVMRHLRPTWKLPHLRAIDVAFLRAAGLRALIWDVDGTLTSYHGRRIASDVADALDPLFAADGVQHAILSNCGEPRYDELAHIFPGIPLIKGYQSARGPLFRVRRGSTEHWSATPAGQLQPIRKPHGSLIDFTLDLLNERDRTAVAVVGDLYLTDIASANLAGVRSIKLPTLRPESFPASVRVLHGIDHWLHRLTR